MRARMRGGILNKAARGALAIPIPAGFVYDGEGRVQLDPDRHVQESVRLLFATLSRTGSAIATVRTFGQNGWKFPERHMRGPQSKVLTGLGDKTLVLMVLMPRARREFMRGARKLGAAPPQLRDCRTLGHTPPLRHRAPPSEVADPGLKAT